MWFDTREASFGDSIPSLALQYLPTCIRSIPNLLMLVWITIVDGRIPIFWWWIVARSQLDTFNGNFARFSRRFKVKSVETSNIICIYIYIRIYTHTPQKNTCLQLLPLWTPHVVHFFYNCQCFPIKSPTKHPHLLLVWLFSFWLLQNPAWCFNSNGCSGNPLFCDVTFSTFFSMKSPIQWP
jgi:hypothetical protein